MASELPDLNAEADEKQLSTLFDSYAGEDEEDKDSMFEEKFGEYCSKIGISFEVISYNVV